MPLSIDAFISPVDRVPKVGRQFLFKTNFVYPAARRLKCRADSDNAPEIVPHAARKSLPNAVHVGQMTLQRRDKGINKFIVLPAFQSRVSPTKIKRILQKRFIVRSNVEKNRLAKNWGGIPAKAV
jgi:hypothetical protein